MRAREGCRARGLRCGRPRPHERSCWCSCCSWCCWCADGVMVCEGVGVRDGDGVEVKSGVGSCTFDQLGVGLGAGLVGADVAGVVVWEASGPPGVAWVVGLKADEVEGEELGVGKLQPGGGDSRSCERERGGGPGPW